MNKVLTSKMKEGEINQKKEGERIATAQFRYLNQELALKGMVHLKKNIGLSPYLTFFGDGFPKKCKDLDFCSPKLRECPVEHSTTLTQ